MSPRTSARATRAAVEEAANPAGAAWWPMASVEDVTKAPIARRCGTDEVVIFRDAQGVCRALEDRCAHRRIPLSLGWTTDQGELQCSYHGWCYDGATGKCVRIPNLREDEPVSTRYEVRRFSTREVNGLSFIWTGNPDKEDESELAVPSGSSGLSTFTSHGISQVPLPHPVFVEALLERPESVVRMPEYQITRHADAVSSGDGGSVVIERLAERTLGRTNFIRNGPPLVLRTETQPITGLSTLTLEAVAGPRRFSLLMGSAPSGPYVTTVQWRWAGMSPLGVVGPRIGRGPLQPGVDIAASVTYLEPGSGTLAWRAAGASKPG